MALELEEELPIPSSIPELKEMNELLRCGICYELMKTCVVTSCSHNYCSLCIRQYLAYKNQCPACFRETSDQQLRINRIVDQIVSLFTVVRQKVAKQLQSTRGNSLKSYLELPASSVVSSPKTPRARQNPAHSSGHELEKSKTGVASSSYGAENNKPRTPSKSSATNVATAASSKQTFLGLTSPSSSRIKQESTPKQQRSVLQFFGSCSNNSPKFDQTSQGSSTIDKQFLSSQLIQSHSLIVPKSPATGSTSQSSAESSSSDAGMPKVSCPVCGVKVPEKNVNLHLDGCLKSTHEKTKQIIDITKRKPMTKLVYSLLSDKQLRQKLKELGLSTQGDRQILLRRHQRFTLLYNSECDFDDPRPVSDIVRQVEREVKEQSKNAAVTSIFTYSRKSSQDVIAEEQIKHLKKHHNQFSDLIADIKKRQAQMKVRKEKREAELLDAAPVSVESTIISACASDKKNGSKLPTSEVTVSDNLNDTSTNIDPEVNSDSSSDNCMLEEAPEGSNVRSGIISAEKQRNELNSNDALSSSSIPHTLLDDACSSSRGEHLENIESASDNLPPSNLAMEELSLNIYEDCWNVPKRPGTSSASNSEEILDLFCDSPASSIDSIASASLLDNDLTAVTESDHPGEGASFIPVQGGGGGGDDDDDDLIPCCQPSSKQKDSIMIANADEFSWVNGVSGESSSEHGDGDCNKHETSSPGDNDSEKSSTNYDGAEVVSPKIGKRVTRSLASREKSVRTSLLVMESHGNIHFEGEHSATQLLDEMERDPDYVPSLETQEECLAEELMPVTMSRRPKRKKPSVHSSLLENQVQRPVRRCRR